jgi:hypothetical protein
VYNASTGVAFLGIGDGGGAFAFHPLFMSPGYDLIDAGDLNFLSLFWSSGYDYVEPQDSNGDEKVDIVLYNKSTGTEYTGISNGAGGFTYTYSLRGLGKILAR